MKLHLFVVIAIVTSGLFVQAEGPVNVRKVKKFRKHTEVDLSGSSVEGKARTPDVFYIFQRKRSQGHDAVALPKSFPEHRALTVHKLEDSLPEQ